MPVPQLWAVLACNSIPSRAGRTVLGAVLALVAVGWPSSASARVPIPVGAPCTVVLEGVDMADWQQVDAKGFTFCVPPAWNVSGSRALCRGQCAVEERACAQS